MMRSFRSMAFMMRATALSMSFIKKGSWSFSRLGSRKSWTDSDEAMPRWINKDATKGLRPVSCDRRPTS